MNSFIHITTQLGFEVAHECCFVATYVAFQLLKFGNIDHEWGKAMIHVLQKNIKA
jgi:hypothetical protein